jgi:Flp pilus assembly protein TadD, contains TPR repeats
MAGPLQNKEKALAYAKKARELAPADPQVAGILGKVAYDSGNFTWSYSVLQEAVRQRPNDPSILHDLAWAAYSLGKVNEARDAMQKVLTDNLNSAQAADAKKFLALAALDENPKGLIAAESELQKELNPILNMCLRSWPKRRLTRSTARQNRQPKFTAISYAGYRTLHRHRNAWPRSTPTIQTT